MPRCMDKLSGLQVLFRWVYTHVAHRCVSEGPRVSVKILWTRLRDVKGPGFGIATCGRKRVLLAEASCIMILNPRLGSSVINQASHKLGT